MEILQNSLIKLISRQGADSDRVNVLLASGEFGYSTDTSRLFIGDGFTYGGNVVGNKFLGITTDLTSLPPGVKGDTAYNSDTNSIFQISINDGSNINDWVKIGGIQSNQILARYDGLSGNTLTYSRGLLSAYRLSAGDYKFDYSTLPTSNLYPTVNIIGVDAFGSQARVVNITNTFCNVHILSSATGKRDANIVFKLDY